MTWTGRSSARPRWRKCPPTGTYRMAPDRNLPHGFKVSCADLAVCMLALLDDPATVRRAGRSGRAMAGAWDQPATWGCGS